MDTNKLPNSRGIRFYVDIFIFEVLCVCAFLIYIWNIDSLSVIHVLDDEFGYWSNASFFAGLDWGSAVVGVPYYSYGYSLVLAPILAIFGGGAAAYHAAVVMNGLFLTGSFILSYFTGKKLFPDINKYVLMGSCFVIAMYPAFIVQASVGWCEAFLIFTVWLTVWCILNMNSMRRMWYFVAAPVLLLLNYVIHQRALGIVVAGVITVLLMFFARKLTKKQLIVFFSVFVGALAIHLIIKQILTAGLYTSDIYNGFNDYSGQTGKIKFLFSAAGIKFFIMEFSGQLFYLGAASFLTVYIAAYVAGREAFGFIKHFKERYIDKIPTDEYSHTKLFMLFLLLSCAATILISVVFLIYPNRWDHLVYGRYNEMLIAPMMLIGLLELFSKGKKNLIPVIASGCILVVLAFVLHFSDRIFPNLQTFNVLCAAGFKSYYFAVGITAWKICLIVIVCVSALVGVIVFAEKKGTMFLLVPLTAMTLFFTVGGLSTVDDPIVNVQKNQSQISQIINYAEENYELPLYYYVSGEDDLYGRRIRAQAQFTMGKTSLICKSGDEIYGGENKIVLSTDTEANNEALAKEYKMVYSYGVFTLWTTR